VVAVPESRGDLSYGFPPISSPDASILILGSLPGRKSLEMRQYYAQPQNSFWRIMGSLFDAGPAFPYHERVARLAASRIAVWDVLAAGERSGSLDSAIVGSSIIVNDFGAFFERHGGLGLICFNGSKAAELYRRKVQHALPARYAALEQRVLPSTSPANASFSFAMKLASWTAALSAR
jgi:hypoxanthine-DNA glycosylase